MMTGFFFTVTSSWTSSVFVFIMNMFRYSSVCWSLHICVVLIIGFTVNVNAASKSTHIKVIPCNQCLCGIGVSRLWWCRWMYATVLDITRRLRKLEPSCCGTTVRSLYPATGWEPWHSLCSLCALMSVLYTGRCFIFYSILHFTLCQVHTVCCDFEQCLK